MNKQRQTLVILSPGFPANEADTSCIPPQQLFVKALKETNPHLHIIVLTLEYPFTKQTYNWHGVQVIAFGGKSKGGIYRLLNWFRVLLTLIKLRRQYQVIGLLSFWFDECAFLGHYFAKLYHLKHYAWILGQDAKPGNTYFNLIRPKPESLIALSDFIARQVFTNYGILPQHTITTGIDAAQFGPNNKHRDIDILGAGSLIPLKHYEVFVETVRFLKEFFPAINTIICGKGPEKEKLLSLINLYGLENNITLIDELPHVQVLLLMQRSKVFLHTSEYEGFGAVLLEALYAGAQVVSFVKPMDRYIAHHHPVKDTITMCLKLLDLLQETRPDNESVLVYPIQQVANSILKLYHQNEAAISSNRLAMASNDKFDLK